MSNYIDIENGTHVKVSDSYVFPYNSVYSDEPMDARIAGKTGVTLTQNTMHETLVQLDNGEGQYWVENSELEIQ